MITHLTKRVKCRRPKFEYFDKDGFDLTEFEALCYEMNGFPVERKANRIASQSRWITSVPCYNVEIHHSYQCVRFGFAGDLADQIDELAFQYDMPNLLRLLDIKPKLGLDVNLEYRFGDRYVIDLFHYEEDFSLGDTLSIERRANEIESLINTTDWDDIAYQLIDKREEWQHLTGDDENDYKARLVGLDRAYRTYKVV